VELEELNRLDGKRSRMLLTDGSGYVMFSRSGRSLATALNDWYRERRSAELVARLAIGMW
jgi:hypothetical protein